MTTSPPQKPEESHTSEQEIYHGDKLVATLRLRDPGAAPPPGGKSRRIPGGPLFDLVALQDLVKAGTVDLGKDEQCYVATDKCWRDLNKLQWTTGGKFTEVLLLLRPMTAEGRGDFFKAEWCEDRDGFWNASDAYRLRVDEFDSWKRSVNAPQYYIKFGFEPSGQLCLLLISCHLDEV